MGLFSLAARRPGAAANLKNEIAAFWKQGFVIVRGAFKKSEMAVLKEIVTRHADMTAHAERARERSAGDTRPSFETVFVWNDTARRDAFAKATRSHRIMDRLEAYFGDPVYVYHNKVALKYSGVVGFSYHQDYAYWYDMGNLYPDMATAFIAVDRATQANGCDAVIFHCNVLHGSDDNHSGESRIGLLGCYNTRHNDPYKSAHGHPGYHPQEKLHDEITAQDLDNLPDFSYRWQGPAET